MPEILVSAISCAFFAVKLSKGKWGQNPQYLVVAIIGGVLASLTLSAVSPEYYDDFVVSNVAVLTGSWLGIFGFDMALGLA
jgi:uncharacterized membrane protein YjjP (DUF1212 family)